MRRVLFILLSLTIPMLALADWPLGISLGVDSHTGGERWDTIHRAGKPDQNIDLGDGLYFYGGAAARLPEFPLNGRLELHSRLGVKTVLGEDDSYRFSKLSYPLELGVRYMNDCELFSALRCGSFIEAGIVYKFAAEYSTRGGQTRDDDFDTQPGFMVRAGWFVFHLGYWIQTYELNGQSHDASSLNIGIEVPIINY